MRSGWAWFFAGTTIALALVLAALLWGLVATGLYGQLSARILPASMGGAIAVAAPGSAATDSANPSPTAPVVPQAADATPSVGATPSRPPEAPAGPAATGPAAQRGEVLASGHWKLLVGDVKTEPGKVSINLTVKNDSERADILSIPATTPAQPRSRPASWEPAQMGEPPSLQLRLLDRASRPIGGGFVGANGEGGGGFTFVAAPGDAIRLPFAFEPTGPAAEPLALEAQFGRGAGGKTFRVALESAGQQPGKLEPSDLVKVNGTEERYVIDGAWSITLLDVSVGQPDASGQRIVTARVGAENLSDRPLAVGASENDPFGTSGDRDFYVVDAAGRLAYSSSDSMPRQPIPPGATRTVDVRMRGYREFATTGPFRFSVVVDPLKNQYAIFRTG